MYHNLSSLFGARGTGYRLKINRPCVVTGGRAFWVNILSTTARQWQSRDVLAPRRVQKKRPFQNRRPIVCIVSDNRSAFKNRKYNPWSSRSNTLFVEILNITLWIPTSRKNTRVPVVIVLYFTFVRHLTARLRLGHVRCALFFRIPKNAYGRDKRQTRSRTINNTRPITIT